MAWPAAGALISRPSAQPSSHAARETVASAAEGGGFEGRPARSLDSATIVIPDNRIDGLGIRRMSVQGAFRLVTNYSAEASSRRVGATPCTDRLATILTSPQ